VSFIMIDLDHFKKLNDRYGHKAGDLILQALSHQLIESTRGGDIACRYGGEEFLVVLPRAPVEMAYQRAEQWRSLFEELRVRYDTTELKTTISAGVATYPANGKTADAVITMADAALYAAKNTGRNRVCIAK
jgi:diguanylate cyclase (GGDEF)-like protein